MITISPIKLVTTSPITFGNNKNNSVGLMALDKNSKNKINFEKDLHITRNADAVNSNPIKAIGYSFVKAYNILRTPRSNSQSETNYIHVPYMA